MQLTQRGARAAVPFDRLRRAVTRLSAAERHAASPAVLNQLADEVLTSRIAVFDEKVARGWLPSPAEQEQRDLDERLLHERADY